MRFNILQINKLYAPEIGGVETVAQDIAEGFNAVTDMRVLVCRTKGAGREEVCNGVRVTRAGSFGIFLSMPLSLDFFRRYRRLSRDADIIQIHAPFPLGDLAAFFIRRKKSRLAVWWHSDIVRQRLFRALLSPFIHHTLKKADLIIVTAKEIIASSSFLPRYAHKCAVIPYGLDFCAYPENPGEEHFLTERLNDKDAKKLLFAGRLVYYKGVGFLVKAMENVQGAELFIVGDGPLREELQQYVREAELEGRIHFLGALPREKLLRAFRDCDVFVFPSIAKSESFGIIQMEAMYYGKPVINTRLPTAVPTVSPHGETGLTVPCADASALSAAIMTLTSDDALRNLYGRNAARRVREYYDRRKMLDTLLKKYTEIMR